MFKALAWTDTHELFVYFVKNKIHIYNVVDNFFSYLL